jgi:hypothetical protein
MDNLTPYELKVIDDYVDAMEAGAPAAAGAADEAEVFDVSEEIALALVDEEKEEMDAEDRLIAKEEAEAEEATTIALDQVRFMRQAQLLAENLGHDVALAFVSGIYTGTKAALRKAVEVRHGKATRDPTLKSEAWEWKQVVVAARAEANKMAGTKKQTVHFKNAEFIRAALGSGAARRYLRAVTYNPEHSDKLMDKALVRKEQERQAKMERIMAEAVDRYEEEGVDIFDDDDDDIIDTARRMAKRKMWSKVARHFDDIDKSRGGEEVTSEALKALRVQVQRPVRQYFTGAITRAQFVENMDRYRDQYLDVLAGAGGAFADELDDE